ncbi:MAG: response regulator transcription factor [Verrucomicrobiota bacterium]
MNTEAVVKVWVVEDNSGYRQGVARAISRSNRLACEREFDSAEALFKVLTPETKPDVILMDVQLPRIDGIAAMSIVRERSPETRSIILTVFDDADKIYNAMRAGASGYLLKSARAEQINAAILEVVEGGAPMTPSVARKVLELFSGKSFRQSDAKDYRLTDREKVILRLMADGLIKKEIAANLEISLHTVNYYIRSIYEKLHVNTNTGAVAKAIREDIV